MQSAAPSAGDRHGRRALIVEDNAAIRDIVSTVLTRRGGFTVATAEDGAVALTRLHEDFDQRTAGGPALLDLDLMVLDIMMPNMTGLELLDVLRQTYTALPPVVVMSALHDEEHVAQALELGAVDYVTKPIDLGVFLHRVQALFGAASETPFHWARLPGRPIVSLGDHTAHARAINEGGIIVERESEPEIAVNEVLPLTSEMFIAFQIPRQVYGRVVRTTKLGRRTTLELAFVGLPDRDVHGIRRFAISR
jgi:DNA-binding response OmpR family regulator